MSTVSGRRPGIGLWRMVSALVRQRRRLALATFAVALGVGYLAGALTLLDRVSQGLSEMAAAGAERADFIVEGDVAYESSLEQTRRLVPTAIVDAVEAVPGVASATSRIEEITVLLDSDGVPLVAPGLSEQPLGVNWPDDPAVSPYRFLGDGRPPVAPDEVVIDSRSAERAGVEVGDTIVVSGKTALAPYTVVGIVDTADGSLPNGSSLALFETSEARLLFDTPDNDNRIAVRLEDGADPDTVATAIRQVLPPGAELVDGPTGAEHRQESLTRSFTLVRVLIMGFAGLALVVGMVTVANSLTLLYAERRRSFATFRLIGARPRQLLGAALIEAAALAAVASLIGAPLGLVLGRLIESVLGSLGTAIPVAGSVVSWSALLWAVAVGILATVVAAVVPARRACRVAAIEAVVEAPSGSSEPFSAQMARRATVALGIAVALGGLLLLGDVAATTSLAVGIAAGVGWILLATLPSALSVLVAAGIRVVPIRPEPLRRIGARDALRSRSRTAATTGALLLATSVVAGLAVFLSSFAASIDGDVESLVSADLVVDSGTFTRGGLPADLLQQIAELPDVAAVSGWQPGRASSNGIALRITGLDLAAMPEVLTPEWVGPEPGNLSVDGVLLAEDAARQMGVSVGDVAQILFTSTGVEALMVQGIYSTGSVLLGEAVMDRQVVTRQVPASADIAGLVALDADTAAGRESVTALASDYGIQSVLDPADFVDSRADLLRGFERVIQWMLLFTLVQALVGVVNTLLLSIGERRRDFGLLRAAGASRPQVLRLVLIEGTSFAVVGTLLGLVVGTAVARVAIGALGRFGITGFVVPINALVLTAVAAIALGVLAALVPARWAASIPPLEAVADAGAMAPLRRRRPIRWGRAARSAKTSTDDAALASARASPQAPFQTSEPAQRGGEAEPAQRGGEPETRSAPESQPEPPPAPASEPAPQRAPVSPPGSSGSAGHPTPPPLFGPSAAPDGPAAPGGRPGPSKPAGRPSPPKVPEPRRDSPFRPAPVAKTMPPSAPAPVVPQRLSAVTERMDRRSVIDAVPSFDSLLSALSPSDVVRHMVQGWTKGLPCVVALTDERVVVVVNRFPSPLIEVLDPARIEISTYGVPRTGHVSLAIVDGRRLLEVTGIRDEDEAAAIAQRAQVVIGRAPIDPTRSGGYF